eukprot:2230025-Rhodomonas_salina.1
MSEARPSVPCPSRPSAGTVKGSDVTSALALGSGRASKKAPVTGLRHQVHCSVISKLANSQLASSPSCQSPKTSDENRQTRHMPPTFVAREPLHAASELPDQTMPGLLTLPPRSVSRCPGTRDEDRPDSVRTGVSEDRLTVSLGHCQRSFKGCAHSKGGKGGREGGRAGGGACGASARGGGRGDRESGGEGKTKARRRAGAGSGPAAARYGRGVTCDWVPRARCPREAASTT